MLEIALAIACALLAVSLAACAALWNQRGRLMADRSQVQAQNESLRVELMELRTQIEVAQEKQRAAQERLGALGNELDRTRQQSDLVQAQNTDLRTQLAVYVEQHKALEEKKRAIEQTIIESRKQFADTFDALAAAALNATSEQMITRAKEVFEAEQTKINAKLQVGGMTIESLVKPIGEGLTKFNESLANLKQDYGSLGQLVGLMKDDQIRLRNETANLVTALRKPEVRGRWGEIVLERVLELSELTEHVHFYTQASVEGETARLRPDVIVQLPRGRSIVIDSKTSMAAFLEALECGEAMQREVCLDRHVRQIEEKIKNLAMKSYGEYVTKEFGRAADFTVLFIPGESFLYAALGRKPNLIEDALMQKIVIATPSTLIALLRVVAMGWREERIAEDAQKISEQGRVLHDRLCTLLGHLCELGSSLGKAVKQYNSFVNSLDDRTMPAIRKLEELQAKSAKELPEPVKIDVMLQESRSRPVMVEAVDGT